MNHPLFWIWSAPRSVSTALERCMLNVAGLGVEHEPFTDVYYFGSERRSDRYGSYVSESSSSDLEAPSVHRRLRSRLQAGPLLVKELAFQGEPYVRDTLLAGGRSIILLRRPGRVYSSLVKLKPDFTDEEFGFDALLAVAERLAAVGSAMLLVDGDELQRHPAESVRRVCRFLGLPYSTELLRWHDGRIRQWRADERDSQAVWHDTLERSHGLVRTKAAELPVPPNRRALIRRAERVHEQLRSMCAESLNYAEAV